MQIINEPELPSYVQSAVTIGKFDGIHIGHKKLLERISGCRERGLTPVALAFVMDGRHIYTGQEIRPLFEENGIEVLIEYEFDDRIKNMSPEQFVKEILIDRLNARFVCVGDDFRFGCNREGDASVLTKLGMKYGMDVEIIDREKIDGEIVSSTRIRRMLDEGNVSEVSRLLGRYYSISGEVVHGRRLGRTLGFPTVNLDVTDDKYIPPNGVYASYVTYGTKRFASVTNIGVKPTVKGNNKIGIETYIFDFDSDIYGEDIKVELVCFLRKETKFDSLEALKEQIDIDKDKARSVLQSE